MYHRKYRRYYLGEELEEVVKRIPKGKDLYFLILRELEKNGTLSLREIRKIIKEYFWLSDEDCEYGRSDKRRSIFSLHIYAAVYYLYNHYLIKRVSRGVYTLTRWGYQVVERYSNIDENVIELLPVRPHIREDEKEPTSYIEYDPYEDDNIGIGQFGLNDKPRQEPVETWYGLSEEEFDELYETDPRFHNIIDSGYFAYYKGSVVPIQYYWGEGEYSKLSFHYLLDSNFRIEIKKNFETGNIYFEDLIYNRQFISKSQFYDAYLSVCKKPFDWTDPEFEEPIKIILLEMPVSTVEIFKYLKKKFGVKWEKLAKILGISDRTLRYWKSPTEEGIPKVDISLEKLIAICLALNLPLSVSELIIERIGSKDKNGFKYDPDAAGGEQRIWKMLLSHHYTRSPQELNDICIKNKVEPLFSQNEEDYKEDPKIDHGIERKK